MIFREPFSKLVIHHFADGTNLLFLSKKLGTIVSAINHKLKLLVHWLRRTKLFVSENNTELLIFKIRWFENHTLA